MTDTSTQKTAARSPVVITRTYKATADEVWALWTTKAGFESWWGPQGFRADVHALDAREGGTLHYDMVADSPEMVASMKQMGQPPSHPVHATFGEFMPTKRLALVSVIDFLPGVTPYESTIGVDFEAIGDETRMIVTLSPMHDAQFTGMQVEGFTSQLTKLDGRFQ